MERIEEIQHQAFYGEPKDLSLTELQLFLILKQLFIMYHNNLLSKEECRKMKLKAVKEYKQQVFLDEIQAKKIESYNKSKHLQFKLQEKLSENKEVTEQRLSELLNLCLEIIRLSSGGSFI